MLLSGIDIKGIGQFFTLLIIFLIVLAITYFSTKFLATYQKNQISGSNIKLLEAARLSQNKYIQLVQIGKRYFALSICKDTVTVIAELSEDELDFSKQGSFKSVDFASVLSKIRNNKQETVSTSEADENNEQN